MTAVLFLPTEGPHLPRKGPAERYDWREQCRLAVQVLHETPGAVIYVPSAFQQQGARSELDWYRQALLQAGAPENALRLDPRGLDTVEQCELACALAAEQQARLVVIVCRVHAARVRYLLRTVAADWHLADGTPSRWLQLTHLVLGWLFPVLDALGLRPCWQRWVTKRRLAGKQ